MIAPSFACSLVIKWKFINYNNHTSPGNSGTFTLQSDTHSLCTKLFEFLIKSDFEIDDVCLRKLMATVRSVKSSRDPYLNNWRVACSG